MNKDNFESIISGLTKGAANIESVNFHFGDCNSTTYMGGDVEEEYEESCTRTCGCDGCGCSADMPVVDNDVVADWVEKKTGIDRTTIEKVLAAETEYLEEIGVAFPVDDGGEDDTETERKADETGQPEQKAKADQKTEPEQKDEAEQDGRPDEKALDELLDKVMGDVMPGLLCMGLLGAVFDDIFHSDKAERKEQKHGKDE